MNKYLLIGLILQALSYCVFIFGEKIFYSGSFVFYLFVGVPLLLGGILLVFGSAIPLWTKLVINFWWLSIPCYSLLLYAYETWRYTPKVYLVDENYQGAVEIYFNQADGEKPVIQDNKLLIRIPASGKVKSSFQAPVLSNVSEGHGEWYYLSTTGKRTPILIENESDSSRNANQVAVHLIGTQYNLEGRKLMKIDFFIGTEEQMNQWLSHQ